MVLFVDVLTGGNMRQFIKFNLVGLVNTALDFLIFYLLVWLGVFYIAAQCMSYCIGMLNSYLLNKYWTFAQKGRVQPKQAVRFIVLNLCTLLLSLGLLALFADRLHRSLWLAKLLATGITTVFNYVGNKLWVFQERETKYS
jgi:putative flippase GtrA